MLSFNCLKPFNVSLLSSEQSSQSCARECLFASWDPFSCFPSLLLVLWAWPVWNTLTGYLSLWLFIGFHQQGSTGKKSEEGRKVRSGYLFSHLPPYRGFGWASPQKGTAPAKWLSLPVPGTTAEYQTTSKLSVVNQPFSFVRGLWGLGLWKGHSRDGRSLFHNIWGLSWKDWTAEGLESSGNIFTCMSDGWWLT